MTRPLIKARRPRLRWYLQLLRLRAAELLALPRREIACRVFALAAAVAGLGAAFAYTASSEPTPPAAGDIEVVHAWVNFVVQIVVMIVAALISYALRPKPKPPEAGKASAPVVEDGKGIVRVFGSVWIDDSIVLGFMQLGTIPIKAKGGKK